MEKPGFPPMTGLALVAGTLLMAMSNFTVVLDTTIANVSIPTISGDLGVSTNEGAWVITSYGVAEAITVPLTGWLVSRFGEVKLFVVSMLGFTLFSALCGLAPNLGLLVLFRVLQGLAGGPIIALSSTLLVSIFPKGKSHIALALWGMTTVVAPIAGPLLGGIICDNWHWSLIFLINVPIGLAIGVCGWLLLRKRESPTRRSPIDTVGLVLLVVFVSSFQVMLDQGRELDWFSSPLVVGCGMASVLSLIVFVIWELTDRHPIVDLSVFRSRTWVVATFTLALMFGLFIGNIVITPLWLQQVMGYTSTWAGYATAPVGVFAVLTAPIVGRLLKKVDPRWIVTFGMGMLAISFMMRAGLSTDASIWSIIAPLLVIGAGVPACIITMTALGISDLPPEKVASGSGLQNFIRVLSLAIGSSLSMTYWENKTRADRVDLINQMPSASAPDAVALSTAHGLPADTAAAAFSHTVDLQSAMLAANDFYILAAVLIVAFAGLIWLAKKPAHGLEAGSGH